MQIPAEIKAKYVRSPENKAVQVIHIDFDEDIIIDAGCTLVINPLNPKVIELRKPGTVPLFRPWYLDPVDEENN